MNSKNIKKSLKHKIDDWLKSIDSIRIQEIIKENAIITGGAIVSLLNGEKPNDYDIYFKTKESVLEVAKYYASLWNKNHKDKNQVEIIEEEERIQCFIRSAGAVMEDEESGIDDESEESYVEETDEEKIKDIPKYRPRYFSTNAISLSDDIQIIIRFYGSVNEIHKNYDYIHCTCSYDYKENEINLPTKALEAIINKELVYTGSKYT